MISKLKRIIKKIIYPSFAEIERLKKQPRYIETTTKLLGSNMLVPDAASFVFTYREIFEKQIYQFSAKTEKPVILDAGANIGLSIIYFKKLYPLAKVIAFEADKKIFDVLQRNIRSFGFESVGLVNKGVWDEEKTLSFYSEGADSGSFENPNLSAAVEQQIQTVRLSSYMNEAIDFLKIDVEGAETRVMQEIEPKLSLVKNLFVEYHSFASQPQTLDAILSILARNNFRYYLSTFGGIEQKHPFIAPSSYNNMDVQVNIFAVRN
jgi:FkbM family methyltransferase